MAACVLQGHSWVLATVTMWPTIPKILIIWTFMEKACWSLLQSYDSVTEPFLMQGLCVGIHVLLQRTGLPLPWPQGCDCDALRFSGLEISNLSSFSSFHCRRARPPGRRCDKQQRSHLLVSEAQFSPHPRALHRGPVCFSYLYPQKGMFSFSFLPWTLWENPDHYNRDR